MKQINILLFHDYVIYLNFWTVFKKRSQKIIKGNDVKKSYKNCLFAIIRQLEEQLASKGALVQFYALVRWEKI